MVEPVFANSINESPVSRELVQAIRLLASPGSIILELGSGQGSTPALAKHFDLYSVEDKPNYIGVFNDASKYIYVENNGGFYNMSMFKEVVKVPYQLLLVDGPDGNNRIDAFLNSTEYFDRTVPWVFDDYNYDLHWKDTMHRISEKVGKEIMPFNVPKPFCVML